LSRTGRKASQRQRLALIQRLFDGSAERYERDITPLYAPLAADLVAYAAPRRRDRVLDLGTGTGIAARLIAPYVRQVVGIDISAASLRVARGIPTATTVGYVRGDLHDMPFPPGAFSLVIASFGLNATDPGSSLRALRRIVAPGGRLVLQEWGPAAPLDLALADVLNAHIVDDPGEDLLALRAWLDAHWQHWDAQFQDADDYRERLEEAGFAVEHAEECAPLAIRVDRAETFLTFKLAWTQRYEELRAMDETRRAAYYAAARTTLADFTAPDGSFTWQPVLFRVTARG
jgi:ubiquinone/menaquinone biosynthesis C-methylase UbiE